MYIREFGLKLKTIYYMVNRSVDHNCKIIMYFYLS